MKFEIIELILVLCTVGLYALGILSWFTMAEKRWVSTILAASGMVSQAVVIAWRWMISGHLPIFGMFEAAIADSFVVVLIGVVISAVFVKREKLRFALPFTLAAAIVFLAQGLFYSREIFPLTISEVSLWVDFHAGFAWVTMAAYTAAAGLSIGVIYAEDEAQGIDEYLFRFVGWGFILHTVMIALGSFYEFLLFGTFWKWDPVEILALVSWASFGLIIHMRLFYGWKTKRFAKLNLVTYIILVASYKALIYFPAWSTFHIFDIGIRMH